MHFEIVPAAELSLAEQARVLNAAFANYVGGWHDLDAESLARFLCLQGSDLSASRFIRADQKLAGFGYLNRTGNILRISAMGIVPEARGSGASNCLLEHLLGEAEARGEQTMMLEVIQQNPRAIALYRRHNFREIGELFGWRRKANSILANEPRSSFEEIPILDALRRPMVAEYPAIPWQISRHALAKVERTHAYADDDACVVISDPAVPPIRIHGLMALPNEWLKLRNLVRAILQHHANAEFFAPAIWPEEFGHEVFQPLGFTREEISQFLMRREEGTMLNLQNDHPFLQRRS